MIFLFILPLRYWRQIQRYSAVGGQTLEKVYKELYTLLNQILQGNPNWHADLRSAPRKVPGVLVVDPFIALQAQIKAMQNHMITKLNNIKLGVTQTVATTNAVQQSNSWYEVCGSSEHTIDAYTANPYFVNYVGKENHQG